VGPSQIPSFCVPPRAALQASVRAGARVAEALQGARDAVKGTEPAEILRALPEDMVFIRALSSEALVEERDLLPAERQAFSLVDGNTTTGRVIDGVCKLGLSRVDAQRAFLVVWTAHLVESVEERRMATGTHRGPGFFFRMRAKIRRAPVVAIAGVAAVLALAVVPAAYLLVRDPMKDVTSTAGDKGLPCASLRSLDKTLFCTMPRAAFDAVPAAERAGRARATMTGANAAVTHLVVDDGAGRALFTFR
jgi:hypothetical protein